MPEDSPKKGNYNEKLINLKNGGNQVMKKKNETNCKRV